MADGLFGTRTASPTIRQVAIQPTGLPGSTYVRPQQREAGGNLRALADALGGLNNALQSFGSAKAAADKNPDSDANRAFLDSIQGKSTDELRDIARQGGLSRIQQDGLNTLLGSKAAYEFRQDLTERYNTEFDQATGDFNSWAEGERQRYAAGLPDDASKAAFFRATETWQQQFGQADLERKVSNAMTERNTAVVDEFRMIADDSLTAGKTPAEIADAIVRQSSLNRDFRGLDGKAQNETMFALASEYALRGEADLVEAILNHDRGGVGPLVRVTGFTDRGLRLLEQAKDVRADKQNSRSFDVRTQIDERIATGDLTREEVETLKATETWITDAQAAQWIETSNANKARIIANYEQEAQREAIRRRSVDEENTVMSGAYSMMERLGGAHQLRDVEIQGRTADTTRTLTAQQQQEYVVQRKLDEFTKLEEELVSRGASPEDARRQSANAALSWFDRNGLMHPVWEKTFNSLNLQSSINRVTEDGQAPKQLADAAELFRQIRAANPAYASKLVHSEKAGDFLEVYSDEVTDGATPEQALLNAARISNRSSVEKAVSQIAHTQAADLARRIMSDADREFRETPQNIAWVAETIQKYMGRGMSEGRAIEAAKQDLEQRVRVINGVVVPDHRDLPPDFEELVSLHLSDLHAGMAGRDGVESPNDYFIEPVNGETAWVVLRKSDGLPVGRNAHVTPASLKRYRNQIAREMRADAESQRAEEQQRRERRLNSIQDEIRRIETDRRPGAASRNQGRLYWLRSLLDAPERERKRARQGSERASQIRDGAMKNAQDLGFEIE